MMEMTGAGKAERLWPFTVVLTAPSVGGEAASFTTAAVEVSGHESENKNGTTTLNFLHSERLLAMNIKATPQCLMCSGRTFSTVTEHHSKPWSFCCRDALTSIVRAVHKAKVTGWTYRLIVVSFIVPDHARNTMWLCARGTLAASHSKHHERCGRLYFDLSAESGSIVRESLGGRPHAIPGV